MKNLWRVSHVSSSIHRLFISYLISKQARWDTHIKSVLVQLGSAHEKYGVWSMPNCTLSTSCGSVMSIGLSINGCLHSKNSFTWENKIDFTVVQKFGLGRLQRLDAIHTEPPLAPRSRRQKGALLARWTFTTRTRTRTRTHTHLISLPYSRLLAKTNGRS